MSMQSITTWTFKLNEPFELAKRFADLEGTALLFSGGSLDSAQTSFLCLFPEEKITLIASKTCWEELKTRMGPMAYPGLCIPRWVGYLGYEMGCFADADVITPYFASSLPDCCFYRPSVVIDFNHLTNRATLYAKSSTVSLERTTRCQKEEGSLHLTYQSDSLESYLEKIGRAKEWILDGEIYQINLSQEFHLEAEKTDPFAFFERVHRLNPAPFSAFIQCEEFAIVSSSPERFLTRRGTKLETRPIKGTMPRGKTDQEDMENRHELLTSEKERAELLMITDLMRNDVGKVSLPGSVQTHEIWRCETYTNVFHLLSIIEGTCSKEVDSVDIVRQLFPGGSITGCPKLRAMQAIAELEKRPRGLYTGSIGYFAQNGDFDLNIAIRTLVVEPTRVRIQLGGAIVIDSDPLKEFEETLYKGDSLFSVLGLESPWN